MGRKAVTVIALLGLKIDHERDPRVVARDVREALTQRTSSWRDLKPKVRYERGRTPRKGVHCEPHKIEVEVNITASDLSLAMILLNASPRLSVLLKAAGAAYEDLLYVEADLVRE